MRITEGNSKIISEILVEINGTTGVHVQYDEIDTEEYYNFFPRNEENVCYLGARYVMYDRNLSSEKTADCCSHIIFMSPHDITEDILMKEAPVMLEMRTDILRST